MNRFDLKQLHKVLTSIERTQDKELNCNECFHMMNRIADRVNAGKTSLCNVPFFTDHLAKCSDCREEYEHLLITLHSVNL